MVMLEVTEKTMKTNMEVMVTELETGKVKNDSSILCSHDRNHGKEKPKEVPERYSSLAE